MIRERRPNAADQFSLVEQFRYGLYFRFTGKLSRSAVDRPNADVKTPVETIFRLRLSKCTIMEEIRNH